MSALPVRITPVPKIADLPAFHLAVQPGGNTTLAVDTNTKGIGIFDINAGSGTFRPNFSGVYNGDVCAFPDATHLYAQSEGALPFYELYFKELTLINARAAKAEDFTGMIDLVERGAVRLEPLVTHRMHLSELEAAIGLVEDGADDRLKIILDHT